MLSRVDKIDKVTEITRLFYEEHLRPTDIAKQIGVGKSYIKKLFKKMRDILKKKNTEPHKAKKDTKSVKEIISIKNDKQISKSIKQ